MCLFIIRGDILENLSHRGDFSAGDNRLTPLAVTGAVLTAGAREGKCSPILLDCFQFFIIVNNARINIFISKAFFFFIFSIIFIEQFPRSNNPRSVAVNISFAYDHISQLLLRGAVPIPNAAETSHQHWVL